ncbi:hypothetical protein SEA_ONEIAGILLIAN_67 [Microbacterium phage OneinaGillian]|uniref:Uncharacterized protein n=1 Tax=Microbacterium phage OneinaGillian TaxID=2301604 RepID=A0A385UKL1_9CAUD|nr:hypothetical protein HOU23_gp067 [Microbacterium phage OneinaGillian]AYB70177.1 hypothetical protein SEA_ONEIAGILLIAN_67 [Microbacterium phage OneinaGillian]
MSVADEAKAAAEAEYPLATEASVSVEASVARMRRVPFAHGYQAGRLRGGIARTREIIELIQEEAPGLAIYIDRVLAERHPEEIGLVNAEVRS